MQSRSKLVPISSLWLLIIEVFKSVKRKVERDEDDKSG
ncbi:hypothetical protein SAMN05421839_1454 [Halolactibacillus halophilus]|uniref:Uncharacterized protein n=1 Tax=Halolactibacillus halophilus TaxID=306540 RepID=A0A1I5SIQ6_9BACI|nr:hypothetical protein SAMN05421839_1454 [Halolactibacillus halophilus]